jgi:hypothetical protein
VHDLVAAAELVERLVDETIAALRTASDHIALRQR